MASASQTVPTRTVVLLRPAERERLERLAATEKVSSGEIIRRSLHSYQGSSNEEDALAASLLAVLHASLDDMLLSLRSANERISRSVAKIDAMKRKHDRNLALKQTVKP